MIIVKAKVKDVIGEFGKFSVASDVADKLDQRVRQMLRDACDRAKENNRSTVMARDV